MQIPFKTTRVYDQIEAANEKRIICLYGGSSSSKTISALQYLTVWGEISPKPLIITIVGESIPVIKRSVMRDWQRIVMRERYEPDRFNRQDSIYTFARGTIMQFISADDEQRFYAMRHDLVLLDEAYNISKGIFNQIEIRTRLQILLTWNPVSPFWATKLADQRDDVEVIHATYHDNPFIEDSIVRALELRSDTDPNFYRVFVKGEYGSLEGLIFKENEAWYKCDELPKEHKRRILVVDYGFTHDPTAILEVLYSQGEFWIKEHAYDQGLFNVQIATILKGLVQYHTEIIADSSEPKSNAELRGMGLNVIDAVKGPDSVAYGLRTMQGFRLHVTRDSINTIKEFRNYSYQKTKDGEWIDKPVDNWNHSIDAVRYGISHIRRRPRFGKYAVS